MSLYDLFLSRRRTSTTTNGLQTDTGILSSTYDVVRPPCLFTRGGFDSIHVGVIFG